MPEVTTSARHILRAAMTRSSEREGIPMIVALVDERGSASQVTDETVLRDGRSLADQVIRIREELAPSMRDGDNGGVISALLTVAHDMTEAGAARD